MIRSHVMIYGACTLALLVGAAPATHAQGTDTTATPPPAVSVSTMDSAFARARRLVIAGRADSGRRIVDSVLAATPAGTAAYGNALYGRAMVAPTAADAERDYRRIVVEYPLSAHAGDALLQLAQLERSQGDRGAAIDHLQRFLRENPASAKRARSGLWLAQLLFEQDDDVQACRILSDARAATAPSDVELQNQMNFYTTRCDVAAAKARADSVARADSLRADSVARADSIRKAERRSRERARAARRAEPSATPTGYSVQVGAFATKSEAEKLVATLHDRGIEARVDGTRNPFRVRVGHYKTRTAANAARARFKKLGVTGFVTSTTGR